MSVISMKQLLEAGVHFGHQTRKWNPKMAKYIFTARNDIHVINLEQTVELIDYAYSYVKEGVKEGKTILFVGTKKQAQDAIKEEAERCGMFYVNSRWLGGTLTNFKTIRSRVDRLNKLTQMEKTGEFNLLPKKEVVSLKNQMVKLEKFLGGVKNMTKLPGMIFVVDSKKEHICVKEARALKIPVIGLIDTNCDPDLINVVIPGNDDAIRSVKLIVGAMADAVIEAREGEEAVKASKPQETETGEVKETVSEIEISADEIVEKQLKKLKTAIEQKEEPIAKPVAETEKPAEVQPEVEAKPAVAKKPSVKKAVVKEETPAEEKPLKKVAVKKAEAEKPAEVPVEKKPAVKKAVVKEDAPVEEKPAKKVAVKKAEAEKPAVKKAPAKKATEKSEK